MGNLGKKLREERERRGLSIEQLAQQTRINPQYFEAIENDDAAGLPGGFFYRSFVRQYARLMELPESAYAGELERSLAEESAAAAARDAAFAERKPNVPPVPTGVHPERGEMKRWVVRLAGFVIILVICTGAYTLWQNWSVFETGSVLEQPVSPKTSEVAQQPPSEVAQAPAPQSPASENQQPPAGANQAAASPPAQEAPPVVPAQSAPAPAPGGATPQTPPAAPARGGASLQTVPAAPARGGATLETFPAASAPGGATVQPTPAASATGGVTVRATGLVWLSAVAKGRTIFSGTLNPGETRNFPIEESLRLRIGDTGALEIGWKGKPVPALAPKGQVRTVEFTPSEYWIVPPPPKP